MDSAGLPTCIEMCIRALQLESSDGNSKATICKTLSCLLPDDLEVKRACPAHRVPPGAHGGRLLRRGEPVQ